LLTEQIHTVWGTGKNVATLLSLDISGAFDTVNSTRLLDILRKKGFPGWLVRWVRAFMTDRTTTLLFQGEESEPRRLLASLPQGSPLSPILFLFYNAELIELCNNPRERLSAIGFVDDVNILAYGPTTQGNCSRLQQAHSKCLEWAKRHGIHFAPSKYELIHFTRRRNAFDLTASVNLEGITQEPKASVRVLGVWLDTKLKWGPHYKQIQHKMTTQTQALSRVAAATWGATFQNARQLYTAIIRPAITYGAGTWHSTSDSPAKSKGLATRLATIQNQCLRIVGGAYRATPIRSLEVETHIPPIDLQLDYLNAKAQSRLEDAGHSLAIRQACATIRQRLARGRGRRRRAPKTPGQKREAWLRQWTGTENGQPIGTWKAILLQKWKERWASQPPPKHQGATYDPPDKRTLEIHKNLKKAESSILIQIRTGCIGLSPFLYKMKVPGVESATCRCREGDETPEHVALWCPEEEENRGDLWIKELGERGRPRMRQLCGTPEGAPRISRWFIKTGRLGQFSLARDLLYG
jgi:hypothetical protein